MIRSIPSFAAALLLLAAPCAHTQAKPAKASTKEIAACSLLTPDQIQTVINSPVRPGQPGPTDCTWKDPGGQDRVYLTLRDGYEWKSMRDSMQGTGRLVPVVGIAEDAFFVSSTGSSAVLYTLKRRHAVLISVTGKDFSKAQNEGAEKSLAIEVLAKL